MSPEEERRAAWAAVPWHTSVFLLPGVRTETAAQLYLAGLRTAGDLDGLILAYQEKTLAARATIKEAESRAVIGALLLWSKWQFKRAIDQVRRP
jgi:hypothetical protein